MTTRQLAARSMSDTGPFLRMKEVFRYARPYSPEPERVGELRNYLYVTNYPGASLVALEKGINPIASVRAVDGHRRPAVVISSSPHKVGRLETPWQDTFSTDEGHIRYYGDCKVPGVDPRVCRGNKALLELFEAHRAVNAADRRAAVPLVFFRHVAHHGVSKGYLEFNGYGVIRSAAFVVQQGPEGSFSNLVFDFIVLDLAAEGEIFDWRWISARRDPTLALEQTEASAPAAWKNWLRHGDQSLERNRRRVARLRVVSQRDQLPIPGSREAAVLGKISAFYGARTRKHRFEALAELVAERVVGAGSDAYRAGWLTPQSADGGSDFVGRLDLGSGLSRTKLVVLGQAKCERSSAATSGRDVARTVARLKRGWIGVYVTTSYFSPAIQIEIIEDEYPLVMIPGRLVARTVAEMIHESGQTDDDFLRSVDQTYEGRIRVRRPEEILHD